jgi:glycosyltransferase involved in cell wall biosynthesis
MMVMGRDLVVIPAFNEAQCIGAVVKGAQRAVREVVVIDDCSSDGCGDVARDAGATVIRNRSKLGYSAAVRSGLSYALGNGYDRVITIDGDNAHDPDEIGLVLDVHGSENNDLTMGDRFSAGTERSIAYAKRCANRFASRLFGAAIGRLWNDVACGLRVFIAC